MKKIIVAGATGFVGQFLVNALLHQGYQVSVIGRSVEKIRHVFHDTVMATTWDALDEHHLQDHYAIVNLAGENIAQQRWSTHFKQKILDSRVLPTQRLVALCLSLKEKAPWLLNASAIGYYGLSGEYPDQPQPVDEQWQQPPHLKDFLSDVARAWEGSAEPAVLANLPVTWLRFGVVLHPRGGMLKKLLPAIKFGLGSILGHGDQMISWIHIHDLIRAIVFILEKPVYGAINLTSPMPTTQAHFMQVLAQRYQRRCYLRLPKLVIKMIFGEMGEALLLGGQNVHPTRLQQENFTFQYPRIELVAHDL